MKYITKQDVELKILEIIDKAFLADDWETFKSKVHEVVVLVTSLEYEGRMRSYVFARVHESELMVLRDMSYKYVDRHKIAFVQIRRNFKQDMVQPIEHSLLKGDVFDSSTLFQMLLKKPELSPEYIASKNPPKPSGVSEYLMQVKLPVF